MEKKKAVIHVADVVRHGDKLILPEDCTPRQGIKVLERYEEYENEVVNVVETLPVFPWDGAIQLRAVVEEMFGFAFVKGTKGMFGQENPPAEISVPVGVDEVESVPWGEFDLPDTGKGRGKITTGYSTEDGMIRFQLVARVQRGMEPTVKLLIKKLKERIKSHSIYRGKAIRMRFKDEDGSVAMRMPKFLDLTKVRPQDVVFSEHLDLMIRQYMWTPIRHPDLIKSVRVPLKRGVLLAGRPGVGKTLLAYVAALEAVQNGWTFIYVEDVSELPQAFQFAKLYGRTVVFAEDLDTIYKGERTAEVNEMLNMADGIDTKDQDIFLILTTNHPDRLMDVGIRFGRIDLLLEILPPDAKAAQKLLRVYAAGLIGQDVDLTEAGERLAGSIPAAIREVAERAKLSFIERDPELAAQGKVELWAEDFISAAVSIKQQNDLLNRKPPEAPTAAAVMGGAVGRELAEAIATAVLPISGAYTKGFRERATDGAHEIVKDGLNSLAPTLLKAAGPEFAQPEPGENK